MNAIHGLTGFYSIAFSNAASTTFTTEMLNHTDASHKDTYSGNDVQGLIDAFSAISRSITSLTGASIHDTMSSYADVVLDETFDANDYSLHVKDANGNEVQGEAAKAFDTNNITLNGKNLTVKFNPNYALDPDYTYSISFDIKPSYDAYKDLKLPISIMGFAP